MNATYFLTGVTGFVGQELLKRLADSDDAKVYCLLRDSKRRDSKERFLGILADLGLAGSENVCLVTGDLTKERMGIEPAEYEKIAGEATHIIHSAADVRFNRPIEKIREINAGGTARILEFTEKCVKANREFSHLSYVSTAFVAGRKKGVSMENALSNGAGFKNTYEQTKYEAERMVRERQADLPIIIYRPSIVLGFSEDGRAKPRNVIYPMLKLFRKWRYPVVSAIPRTRLDMVPVDFVAGAILHISADSENLGKCFHLAAGPDGDVTLGQFMGILSDEFGKKVVLMPPAFWRMVVRPLLKTFKRDFYERSTGIFRAFEPYIWEENPRYSVDETRKALEGSGIDLPDTDSFLRACFRFAVETDFGENGPAGN